MEVHLRHIIDAINDIENSAGKLTKAEFDRNKDVRDATLRRIEVIGEAVKNISNSLRERYSQIEWRKIAGARDVIIHAYFSVDWELVWEMVKKDISVLKKQISEIIKES